MVLVEIYPISVPIISLDWINGFLSVTFELNFTPSVLGVEINTHTSNNSVHLPLSCRSMSQGHSDTSLSIKRQQPEAINKQPLTFNSVVC